MSRVRDKADFQFAGEDYTHGSGVKYVANMIQTTDLDASGTISNVHLQDIADVAAVSASNDGHFLKYDHSTTAFVWAQASGGGGGGSMNDLVDDTTPQLGGNLDANGKNISFGDSATPGTDDTLSFGADNDLQIYHNSSDGHNYMQMNDKRLYIKAVDNGLTGPLIYFDHDTSTPSTVDFSTVLAALSRDSAGVSQLIGQISYGTPNVTSGSFRGSIRFDVTDSNGAEEYVRLDGNNDRIDLKKAVRFSSAFTFPTSDGLANQVLQTDGAGAVSWATVSGGGASTGDISFSASTISSSGSTITLDDDVTVTGVLTSSQAGSPILTSASSLTLQATDRVHVNQSPFRLYNVTASNRNTLTAADGDLVYDSDVNSVFAYQNGSWVDIGGGGSGSSATTDILTIQTSSTLPSAPSSGSVHIYEDNSTLTFMNSRAGTGHYQLKMENSAGTFLMGVDGLGNIITSTSGTMRAQYFYAVSNTSYYVAPALTTTAMQLAGDMKTDGSYIGSIKERANADTTTSGTLDFDSKDYEIYRLTQNQTANRTLNIRGDGSTTLDSIMSNDEFRTVAIAFKNGSTPYYFNAFEIDGSAVTPLWSGGSAPSAGNASSTDFYTFSICKTGSATFEVYGSFTRYA